MEILARDAYKIKMQIKLLEVEYNKAMATLKKEAAGVTTQWGSYRVVISSRPGAVDYAAIPQLKDVNLDSYRKEAVEICKLECLGV